MKKIAKLLVLISCAWAVHAGASTGTLKGHFEITATGPLLVSKQAEQLGRGRAPLADSKAGLFKLSRVIDTPCPPGCTPVGPLPNTAQISLTGTFDGFSSTSLITALPFDPLLDAKASYTGPGALAFAEWTQRFVGSESFTETHTTTFTMTLGTDLAYAIDLNGYAYVPFFGLGGDFSLIQASLFLNPSVLGGQNFEIACVPEPGMCLLAGSGLFIAFASRRGKQAWPASHRQRTARI